MKNLFTRFVREEAGQDLIGYALLAGLISIVCVIAISPRGRRCLRCSVKSRPPSLSRGQHWAVSAPPSVVFRAFEGSHDSSFCSLAPKTKDKT